ncbi:hypothetical protein ADUPG1_006482 [Aduncisulcus paluster]|uniref:Uncharacterized protein n=1 Tax=Aduncisulcus paluster TaxID=2918883 RepID=A0ABQ5KIF1_9EUKA|nr:hypothetical protein ADUPG1_006482 [Aduncisulcus paluster]
MRYSEYYADNLKVTCDRECICWTISTCALAVFVLLGTCFLGYFKPLTQQYFDRVDDFVSTVKALPLTSFDEFTTSFQEITMDLSLYEYDYHLDFSDFTPFTNQICHIDSGDMKVLIDRGITEDDMKTFFYSFSPLDSRILEYVSFDDSIMQIKLFQNLSELKSKDVEYIERDYSDSNSKSCEKGQLPCLDQCLSASFPQLLEIDFNPTEASSEVTMVNVMGQDDESSPFTMDLWLSYSETDFSCSGVSGGISCHLCCSEEEEDIPDLENGMNDDEIVKRGMSIPNCEETHSKHDPATSFSLVSVVPGGDTSFVESDKLPHDTAKDDDVIVVPMAAPEFTVPTSSIVLYPDCPKPSSQA